jgi:hypothetical protein
MRACDWDAGTTFAVVFTCTKVDLLDRSPKRVYNSTRRLDTILQYNNNSLVVKEEPQKTRALSALSHLSIYINNIV